MLTCVSAVVIAALALLGMVAAMASSPCRSLRCRHGVVDRDGDAPPHGGRERRRPLVSRALALDTMSNSVARLVGPIAAGVIYQRFGIAGRIRGIGLRLCAGGHASSRAAIIGRQPRRLVVSQVPRDLAEGVALRPRHTSPSPACWPSPSR